MNEKALVVGAAAVGAIGLVAFAAYEYTKAPASALTSRSTTTTTPQTYNVNPSAAGLAQSLNVGDTLNVMVPTSTVSGQMYAFDQTLSTLKGWTAGNPVTQTSGGVSVTSYPFTATEVGQTTFSVSLYATSDGVNVTQPPQQMAGSTLKVIATVGGVTSSPA
jgi:hypothetical protein